MYVICVVMCMIPRKVIPITELNREQRLKIFQMIGSARCVEPPSRIFHLKINISSLACRRTVHFYGPFFLEECMNRLLLVLIAMVMMTNFGCTTKTEESMETVVQPASPIILEGYWEGDLAVQEQITLKLGFSITRSQQGYTAKLSVPQQGIKDLPIASTEYDSETRFITFTIDTLQAVFSGTIETSTEPTITGTFEQSGMALPLILHKLESVPEIAARMQDPKPPYPYISEDVMFLQKIEGFELAGTITRPKENGRYPAVILISGSGQQDRDEAIMGHRPFLVLADALTRAGIVVLRYDDRGVGSSKGTLDTATSLDFADDAESALEYLTSLPFVDHERLGIIGHSEGGLIAPIIASRNSQVDFIVLMAAPGVDGIRVLEDQSAALLRAQGAPEAAIQQIVALNKQIYTIIIDESLPVEQRKAQVSQLLSLTGMTPEAIQNQLSALFSPWYMAFLTIDPAPYLSKVDIPTLILNGSKDTQVTASLNVPTIETILKESGNTEYTTKIYEGLNHLFQPATTGSVDEYASIETTIEPMVLEDIAEWIVNR